MKEIFVIYGRDRTSNDVYDWDGIYFRECPILKAFDNWECAYEEFVRLVLKAYKDESKTFEEYPQGLSKEEILNDYTPEYDEDEDEDLLENDIRWEYYEEKGKEAYWQVHTYHFSDLYPTPIRPGIYLEKLNVKEKK